MRTRATVAAIALVIAAPTVSLSQEDADGETLLSAYVEIWNGGDLGRLGTLVTPDFRRHGGPDESCRSVAELERLITGARRVWKRLRITVEDSMATPEGGAVRGSFYGVHRTTNGIIEFPTMSMFRFEEGKIAEEWIIGDNFLPLMALGYELVPPGFEIVPPPGDGATRGNEPDPGLENSSPSQPDFR
jgi:hypothetical protein